MNLIYILSVILIILPSFNAAPYNHPLFISCGLSKSTTANPTTDGRQWKSDDNPAFAPANLNTISSSSTTDTTQVPPYDTARFFKNQLTYSFSLSPGPKFIRLHFITTYNNISFSQAFLSLQANKVILFKNFSPYLNSPQKVYEFHLTIEEGVISANNLNLTFSSSGDDNNNGSYGFINGIEIVPVPQGLYIDLNKPTPFYITNPSLGYTSFSNLTGLQNVFRLNVGGGPIKAKDDSGNMWRTWLYDQDFLARDKFSGTQGGLQYGTMPDIHYTNIPDYVAPPLVYATERIMGQYPKVVNLRRNLTWKFEVDPGFDYLVRLHFCEMNVNITKSGERVFNVYVNSQMADPGVDIIGLSGGRQTPIYRDNIIRIDGGGVSGGNATKVPLSLALHPSNDTYVTDVLLNGLEIFRISEIIGNSVSSLAVPNPPKVDSPPLIAAGKGLNHHHSLLPLIMGIISGIVVISLLTIACIIVYKRRAKEDTFGSKSMATNTSTKYKWIPSIFHSSGSTPSSISSSLPSDVCRRFSLAQIKAATCDFDKNLIIGKGGFGEVYKGSILDATNGTIPVAIKRLNTSSKQGAREFQTEIETLSRLRHVHLVPLIGFCEDDGEMILVYEYMSRGTLQDHLMYKNSETSDDNNTPLSWKQRLMICVGSARGLHYLHAGARQLIVHRDVKSTNILLDDKWTAKVSDFGLSKAGPILAGTGPAHFSTTIKGSAGYLDPEYYRRHQLTEKSDVYSFGVVLFEVLCARAVVNPNLPKEQANLAMWAQNHFKKGTLHKIVDPNITSQIAPECLRKFGEIAESCVRDRGSERPSMEDVVWGLEFALQLQETAEKNNHLSGGSLEEVFGSTSNSNLIDGNTDNEVFSTDNFSQSSNGDAATRRLMVHSKTTTSDSSDYPIDMKCDSVFSEIIHPTAR